MFELNVNSGEVYPNALDGALRSALGEQVIGLSTYGPDRPISIWLEDDTHQSQAAVVAAAHDPIFLSVDKTTIQADGVDEATVTVRAPKSGAAPVTLLIGSSEVPVNLTSGIGQVGITSPDPQMITVSVKNPANRSSDTIHIQAVI